MKGLFYYLLLLSLLEVMKHHSFDDEVLIIGYRQFTNKDKDKGIKEELFLMIFIEPKEAS